MSQQRVINYEYDEVRAKGRLGTKAVAGVDEACHLSASQVGPDRGPLTPPEGARF